LKPDLVHGNGVYAKKFFAPKFLGKTLTTIKLSPDTQTISVGDILGHIYVLGVVIRPGQKAKWDVVADWQVR